jgi:hypothetical protein
MLQAAFAVWYSHVFAQYMPFVTQACNQVDRLLCVIPDDDGDDQHHAPGLQTNVLSLLFLNTVTDPPSHTVHNL